MNNILILGLGTVGKAVAHGFRETCRIYCIDPAIGGGGLHRVSYYGQTTPVEQEASTLQALVEDENTFIFYCGPVPTIPRTPPDYDGQALQDLRPLIVTLKPVLEHASSITNVQATVVIKSTVLPAYFTRGATWLHWLSNNLPKGLVVCPEFLNARTAIDDFVNASVVVSGSTQLEAAHRVNTLHKQSLIGKTYFELPSPEAACFVKYGINNFFAVKNAYFTALKQMVSGYTDINEWGGIVQAITADPRITDTHTHVPGHDGALGFGGACLPKDLESMINMSMLDSNTIIQLLQAAQEINLSFGRGRL